MALLAVQCTFQTATLLPEDRITNTWHFDDGEDVGAPEDIADELQIFYNAIRPYLSSWMVQNGQTTKMYRLSDPEPRAPIFERTWNFTSAPSGNMLPPECAAVMSFQGEPVSGVPQARRRGRVYLGALSQTTLDTTGLFTTTFVTAVKNAGLTLVDASSDSLTWKWAVYSRVLGSGVNVANGWVDNEIDTQRRRQRRSTARQTFVPLP